MNGFNLVGSARDPERIGRTGGRPPRSTGFARMLGKALGQGWINRDAQGQGSQPRNDSRRALRQRVIVKARVVHHGPRRADGTPSRLSRGGASLARHVCYLGREGTSRQGERGQFYDHHSVGLDARQITRGWYAEHAPDKHHFRLIISPENGEAVADLTAYVRLVMDRVERDLVGAHGRADPVPRRATQRRLQWVAVNHFNTGQPHAHVLLRGLTGPMLETPLTPLAERSKEEMAGATRTAHSGIDPARARVLILSRRVISHGLRERAEEVATELLGERPLEAVRDAGERQVGAARWTPLDRQLLRQIEIQGVWDRTPDRRVAPTPKANRRESSVLCLDVAPDRLQGAAKNLRRLLIRRLQTLAQYGLAHPSSSSLWQIDSDIKERLIALGIRGDIVSTLHQSLGAEAGRVVPYGLSERLCGRVPSPLAGKVIAHGIVDSTALHRYLVVESAEGVRWFVRVREGREYERVKVGVRVEIGQEAAKRWRALEGIKETVLSSSQQVYARHLHESLLRRVSQLQAADQEALLGQAEAQLARLTLRDGSGVERTLDAASRAVYHVAPEALDRQRRALLRSPVTDLRVLSDHTDPHNRSPSARNLLKERRPPEDLLSVASLNPGQTRVARSANAAQRSPEPLRSRRACREREDLELG